MATTSTTPTRAFGKLFSAVATAAALCASSAAQAGVLDFETPLDSRLVFSGDVLTLGEYWVGGATTDMVGPTNPGMVGVVDDNSGCDGIDCPVNNNTKYYSAVADGYLAFGKIDGSKFKISSFDASFIGGDLNTYPAVSGLLYLAGYNGATFVEDIFLELSGPVNGSFNFANYAMSRFGDYEFTDVLIASYACNAAGDCDRTSGYAQFAIDNITTYVPEPGSFALMGLGLLGLGAFSRRRAA